MHLNRETDAEHLASMTRGGDVEITFSDPNLKLRVHSTILRMTSNVMDAMLSDVVEASGGQANASFAPLELRLDDNPQDWRDILPLLYPRMHTPRLTWSQVRRIVGIAHKYDITLVLKACEAFLEGESAALSAAKADPNYVLDWLEISERLHLDRLRERCLAYIRHGVIGRTAGSCDYCGARCGFSRGSSGGGTSRDVVGRHHPAPAATRPICACVCEICKTRRMTCTCGAAPAAAAATAAAASTAEPGRSLPLRSQLAASSRLVAGVAVADPFLGLQGAHGQSYVRRSDEMARIIAGLTGRPYDGAATTRGAEAARGAGRASCLVRDAVLRDREGLSRLSVRSLVDLLTPGGAQ